jgi:DNA-binding transcriptional regulator/RsmH inhibitor MraZ
MPKILRPVDSKGRIVLPKDLLENWNCKEVVLHPNAFATLVTPKGADLKKVIRSIEILLEDIKNQAEV